MCYVGYDISKAMFHTHLPMTEHMGGRHWAHERKIIPLTFNLTHAPKDKLLPSIIRKATRKVVDFNEASYSTNSCTGCSCPFNCVLRFRSYYSNAYTCSANSNSNTCSTNSF